MRNKFKWISALCLVTMLFVSAQAYADDSGVLQDDSSSSRVILDPLPPRLQQSQTQTQTKLSAAKAKLRQGRIVAIGKVYAAQIDRAQKALDRMQEIMDRLQAQRAKLTGATDADLAAIDALISQAQTQKQTVVTDLANVKSAADAIKTTLSQIKSDTDNSDDTSTTNISNLKQQVKDFQTKVKTLKKDLITLHQTLTSILQKMRAAQSSKATTPTAGEENQ
ncbi:MAG TPA: hypothetical protein VFX17_03615 [Patescibacteria group bacterium]|nr:hypothetical protein [Patescibacteria group bacterium]